MSDSPLQIFPASRWEVYDPDKDYGAYVGLLSVALLFTRLMASSVSPDVLIARFACIEGVL